MNHEHITKILEFKFDEKHNFIPALYGCTECDETSTVNWSSKETKTAHATHTSYVDDCFGCKVRTLELNPGDAGRAESMPQKKWDKELDAYKSARKQGIQPAGTTMKAVQEALDKSDKMGKAYNANVE